MKLEEIKKEIQKYQYLEDTKIIDVALASIISNRLKIGDPVWLILIGASSGGKSQILRPLALTDTQFIHRIDDITDNTFLSGAKTKDGSNSLLDRIKGHGIIVVSDLTVIMSKSSESRATVLSQLRMLYDGEMVKHSGNRPEPLRWEGYLGMIAGSTPSIYASFEEVSDMGERFIYFRMKEIDSTKATHLALSRPVYGKELDSILSNLYRDYITEVVKHHDGSKIELSEKVKNRIIEVASFAERVRTVAHMDWRNEIMTKIPVPALPMRVALQLMSIAKALSIIKHFETGSYELDENALASIDWVGYSLANEEKRACLKILASGVYDVTVTTSSVADRIGLDTDIVRNILQNLSAVGVLVRSGVGNALAWSFKRKEDYEIVRRIENISSVEEIVSRDISDEETAENDIEINPLDWTA